MKVVGLITARAGSKGLPGKNLRQLAGRSLLSWTCQAALGAKALSRVILSTDGEDIAAAGREAGVEVPFMRPAELASDRASSIDVAVHAVRWLEEDGDRPDAVVLLQPTSPLRRAEHIDAAVGLLTDGVDTVVSVVEVPHHFSPYKVMRQTEGRLEHFIPDPLPFDRYRRQELPPVYARNGPAVLVTRTTVLLEGTFYGSVTVPLVMDERDSIDIDTEDDLQLAELMLERRS